MAVLRFTLERARWGLRDNDSHQEGKTLKDGSYELRFLYADDRELIMDAMKHGKHCRVINPKSLEERVTAYLEVA